MNGLVRPFVDEPHVPMCSLCPRGQCPDATCPHRLYATHTGQAGRTWRHLQPNPARAALTPSDAAMVARVIAAPPVLRDRPAPDRLRGRDSDGWDGPGSEGEGA